MLSFARYDKKQVKEYRVAWNTDGSVAIDKRKMFPCWEKETKMSKVFIVRCEVRTHDLWITLI